MGHYRQGSQGRTLGREHEELLAGVLQGPGGAGHGPGLADQVSDEPEGQELRLPEVHQQLAGFP